MINVLTRKISRLLEKHQIATNDINTINSNILKQLNNSQNLHALIENHIAHLIKKYGIDCMDIYRLNDQIWHEVIHFKFNNRKLVIALNCKSKKIRL